MSDVSALCSDMTVTTEALNKKINEQANYLAHIGTALKKLRNDRKLLSEELAKMQGALQAYTEVQKRLQPSIAPVAALVVDPALVSDVVNEVPA